jgi:hypothetical protein
VGFQTLVEADQIGQGKVRRSDRPGALAPEKGGFVAKLVDYFLHVSLVAFLENGSFGMPVS